MKLKIVIFIVLLAPLTLDHPALDVFEVFEGQALLSPSVRGPCSTAKQPRRGEGVHPPECRGAVGSMPRASVLVEQRPSSAP
jgi:hypothetical protein